MLALAAPATNFSAAGGLTSLSLASGSTLGVALTPTAGGANAVTTASLTGTYASGVTFAVGAQGRSLATGTYTVLQGFSGATPTVPTVAPLNIRGLTATAAIHATNATVTIAGSLASANLTWSPSTQDWDVNLSNNWLNNGTSMPDNFFNLDQVTFDDGGLTAQGKIVNVIGSVHPLDMVFNVSDPSAPFVFQGSGAITGTGTTLTKSGPGTVIINTVGGLSVSAQSRSRAGRSNSA